LGFFHQIDYGRPSLALDLLEELRAPLVDRFSAGLLNLGIFRQEDFSNTPEKGALLSREALKRYFVEYGKELSSTVSLGEESLTGDRFSAARPSASPARWWTMLPTRLSACHVDRRLL
jgi:CRISPR/Cas system-associated endonuclease Cas1